MHRTTFLSFLATEWRLFSKSLPGKSDWRVDEVWAVDSAVLLRYGFIERESLPDSFEFPTLIQLIDGYLQRHHFRDLNGSGLVVTATFCDRHKFKR